MQPEVARTTSVLNVALDDARLHTICDRSRTSLPWKQIVTVDKEQRGGIGVFVCRCSAKVMPARAYHYKCVSRSTTNEADAVQRSTLFTREKPIHFISRLAGITSLDSNGSAVPLPGIEIVEPRTSRSLSPSVRSKTMNDAGSLCIITKETCEATE